MLIRNASWISMGGAASTVVPVFRRLFACGRLVRSAVLEVTCDGVYEAMLNGSRIGNFILAPWRTGCSARQPESSRLCRDMPGSGSHRSRIRG